MPQLYLASQSPRRRELLDQLGIKYTIISVDIDETAKPGESAGDYVCRLAKAKAAAAWDSARRILDIPVLGADTAIGLEQTILGKPTDRQDALRMLQSLAGREHKVFTAVCLYQSGQSAEKVSETLVYFRKINTIEAEAYWDTGEPGDKAGAYAIQGKGAVFVQRIEGSYSAVMGLPVYETSELLTQFGLSVMGVQQPARQPGSSQDE